MLTNRGQATSGKIILAIREMIEWGIAAQVGISYGCAQSSLQVIWVIEKSRQGDGRSESKLSCRVRKIRYGIEQSGMISRGTLSHVMRRVCITSWRQSRQARSGENLEKKHRGKRDSYFC